LQLGIGQAKASDAAVYELQRAIELDAGRRFAIVSNRTDKWVEELHQSAQTMIHTPFDKADWQKVMDDAEARISEISRTGNRNAAEQLLSQVKRAVKEGQEKLLDRAVIDTSINDPDVIGFQWRLSGSRPATDICDYCAYIEMGLGSGSGVKKPVF